MHYHNFNINLGFIKTNKIRIKTIKQYTATNYFFCCLDDKIKIYCTDFTAEYIHNLREDIFAGI